MIILTVSPQQVPLFAVVNDDVFVLHGGLFHTRDARISELNDINRPAFSLEDLPENGEELEPVPREQREEYLKQLVRDALWSDPVNQDGLYDSVRGERWHAVHMSRNATVCLTLSHIVSHLREAPC